MTNWRVHGRLTGCGLVICALALVALRIDRSTPAQEPKVKSVAEEYATAIQPLVKKYCLGCHSTKLKKGSLDLERFATLDDARKEVKVWLAIVEQLEAGEMPPKEKPQPTLEEKKQLLMWIRGFLDAEAKARSGD